MLNFLKNIILCLCAAFLQSCFHSSDDKQNTVNYVQDNSGRYVDSSGDAAFDFIDLTEMKVAVTDTEIEITINILNLPNEFTYDQVNTPDNALEYGWQIYFDVDTDSSKANDISFAINSFKFSDDVESTGSILNFTQKDAWQGSADNSGFSLISSVNVATNVSGNTITMSILKSDDNSLSNIKADTPVRFETVNNASGVRYIDVYPEP